MTKRILPTVLVGAVLLVGAAGAIAQVPWTPGSEIAGQTIQVQTNGIFNSIHFGADGSATITAPNGTTVPGTWSAANNMLCLNANGGQECWPYSRPFQAGQQIALTSNCQQVTTFMPPMINAPMERPAGERG